MCGPLCVRTEILGGEQPPIPQSLVETALAAERETQEQLARTEEAEAVKEHKEEIERLVSKAVLSRCPSSHTVVGRSLSRKGTASVLSTGSVVSGGGNHMSRVSSWRVGGEDQEDGEPGKPEDGQMDGVDNSISANHIENEESP